MESDFQNGDKFVKKLLVATTAVVSYILYWNPNGVLAWLLVMVIASCILMLTNYDKRRNLTILWRDIRCLKRLILIDKRLKQMVKNNETLPKLFKITCDQNPDKTMYHFEDQSWTFKQVDEFSNKVANYFLSKGLKQGETVAIYMETRLEYVPLWLGLQKIGASAALVNHNLTGDQLAHSLKAVPNTSNIIFGTEVAKALGTIRDTIKDMTLYSYGNGGHDFNHDGLVDLEKDLAAAPSSAVPDPGSGNDDNALYIFTSGTTGLPKAVVMTHGRIISYASACNIYLRIRNDDVVYVTLPLYHTNGGCLAACQAVCYGATVALRKKFSASNFWKDCCRYNCTIVIYIGELCRFLLAASPTEDDRKHKIRLMFGNGLKRNIWERFVNRFNIKNVAELYGSTEGIGPFMNSEGVVGAVGHFPLIWKHLIPIYLVKIDHDKDMPLRDKNGRCILVTQPNEPGMHISKIIKENVGQDFRGYSDRTATSKKIITDVFEPGDRYFVSGDIFYFDQNLFVYFQDRTGDTFRWLGENVSTTEVEQILTDIVGLQDVAVYGVEVPGTEGKAGMAAIVGEPTDLEEINRELKKRIAKYARPMFLRYLRQIDMTSTFKIKKQKLMTESFNPHKVKDLLFYYDKKDDKYRELTNGIYEDILNERILF